MKIGIAGAAFAVFLVLFVASQANAHVLLSEQEGQGGAVIHIVPDDDPIAGKESTLFFDTQSAILNETSTAALAIESVASSEAHIVATKIDNSLITAGYTFPYQGVYKLKYTINSSGAQYRFEHVVRVTRGVLKDTAITQRHVWAEALLLGAGILLIVLIGVAWRYRRVIARQSTF